MPFSEILFHKAVFLLQTLASVVLWINWWLLMLPFSACLAWQDFKYLRVNQKLASVCIAIFVYGFAGAATFYLGFFAADNYSVLIALFIYIVLSVYRKFRPLSIQKIDINFFSLGILWLGSKTLPFYCLFVALALLLLKIILKQDKLPFLTAWFIGFWISFLIQNQVIGLLSN